MAKGEYADGWHICWLPPLEDGTLAIYFGLWCDGDCVLWTAPVAAPPPANQPRTTLGPPMPLPVEVPNAHPRCLRKLLPESDGEWASLRPHARWSVCVCGGGHAALPQLLASGDGPSGDAQSAPPFSRLAEPDPVLIDSMRPAFDAALVPLTDARLMLADAHASLERLNASSSSIVLEQLQSQLETANRRLEDLHNRLAPAHRSAEVGAPNGHAAPPSSSVAEPGVCGTLLGKLCVMAAQHYAAPVAAAAASQADVSSGKGRAAANGGGRNGRGCGSTPTDGGGVASAGALPRAAALELSAVCMAGSADKVREAMGIARWGALNGVAIYGGKLSALKGEVGAARKRPLGAKRFHQRAGSKLAGSNTAGARTDGMATAGGSGSAAVFDLDAPEAAAASRLGGGKATVGSASFPPGTGKAPAGAARGGKAPGGLKRQLSNGSASPAPANASPRATGAEPSFKRPKPPPAHMANGRKAGKGAASSRPVKPKKPAVLPPENMRTRVMPSALRILLSMGYSREDAESALRRVGGADIQNAIGVLANDLDD